MFLKIYYEASRALRVLFYGTFEKLFSLHTRLEVS
jgi:hypothetical protein